MVARDVRAHTGVLTCFFLCIALAYSATSRGNLTGDPADRMRVAHRVLTQGTVSFEAPSDLAVPTEYEGRVYSVFAPGQAFVFAPALVASMAVVRLGYPADPLDVASFLNSVVVLPCIAALGIMGLVVLLLRLGWSLPSALAWGAIAGFATPIWVVASTGSEEPILAGISAWVAVLLYRGSELDTTLQVRKLGLAACLLAFGMTLRPTFAVVAVGFLPLSLPLLWNVLRDRQARLRLLPWAIATACLLGIYPLYNHVRFGDWTETGYRLFYADVEGGLWGTPLGRGLVGHLLSPGFSLFLYTPLALLSVVGLCSPRAWRSFRSILLPIALALALHLVLYSLFTFWQGGWIWGVRFHVSMMLLLVVSATIAARQLPRRFRRPVLSLVVSASVLVQVAGLSLSMGLEQFQRPQDWDGLVPREAAWTWEGSPWRLRFVNIGKKLTGEPLFPAERGDQQRAMQHWNYYPIRGPQVVPSQALFLRGFWLTSVLALIGSVVALRRCLRATG